MPRFLYLLSPVTARQAVTEWVARHAAAGVVRSGARVEPGARLERSDGVVTVGDAEARWGFLVVEAEDARAALAIAASCPGAEPARIELYRLDPAEMLDEARAPAATLG
jgi:hypothetical protein